MTTLRYPLCPGPAGFKNISLVIFFDYEREFGYDQKKLSAYIGYDEAKVSANKGFLSIMQILRKYKIKATWNCVGLIAHNYPETIDLLISEGKYSG